MDRIGFFYAPDGQAGRPVLQPRPAKIKVKLADGKARTIQHMTMTSFWHPDGTPMSARQFLEELFGNCFAGFQQYLYQPGA